MKDRIKQIFLQNSLLFILFMIILAFSILNKGYLTRSNMVIILRQASLLALLGFAQTLVILTGCIDLSLGAVISLSTVAFGWMLKTDGLPFMVPVISIVLCGALLGLITSLIVTKLHIPPFIATFATNYAYRGVAWLLMGSYVYYDFKAEFRFLGMGELFGIPMPIVFEIFFGILFMILLRNTTLGREIYFIGSNRKTAEYSGINSNRTITIAYVISSALAAFTGVLYISRLNAAEPALGTSFSLDSVATSLIGGTLISGGRGGVWGTAIGAIIIATIKNGMNFLGVSSEMQLMFLGLIIVFAVFFNEFVNRKLIELSK